MKTLNFRFTSESPTQEWQGFSVEIRYLVAQAVIDAAVRAESANPARLVPHKVAAQETENAENTAQVSGKSSNVAPAQEASTEKVGATQRTGIGADGIAQITLPVGAEIMFSFLRRVLQWHQK